MRAIFRYLAIFVALSAGAAFIAPASQDTPSRNSPPIAAKAARVATPSAQRIVYRAGHYPVLTLPGGQRETVRSALNIAKPMRFGDFVWNEKGVPQGPVWIRIDLAHQLLSVFRAGHEIGSAVILFGGDSHDTPTGSFTVLAKDAHYYSHSYNAPMPYALRLTNDGVAIHGSDVRKGWATHGCIGVPMDFAHLLFGVTHKGDLVAILPA